MQFFELRRCVSLLSNGWAIKNIEVFDKAEFIVCKLLALGLQFL